MNDSPGWAPPGPSPTDEPHQPPQPSGAPTGQGGQGGQGDQGAASPAGPGPDPVLPDQPGPAASEGTTGRPMWGAKWAERQPPEGHWAPYSGGAPTPPPAPPTAPSGPGGPAGPPSYGSWGPGWTQPPPAPRPGVIPLRPLGVGEILDGALSTLRAHWRPVLGVSLVVALVTQAATTAATGLWFRGTSGLDSLENDPNPSLREALDALGHALQGSAVPLAAGILGTLVTTALLTIVAGRAVLGRPMSSGEMWRDARPRLLQLCGLLLLLPALVAAAFAAGLAPGLLLIAAGAEGEGAALALLGGLGATAAALWLWIRYSLAVPALMLEKQGLSAAMRRSAKLVRGAWWRALGIQLLALLIAFVVSAIFEIPSSIVGMAIGGDNAMDWLSGESISVSWTFLVVIGIGGVLASTITLPISAGVTVLLYVDQRIRREALDLELARAAGNPDAEK
ncbi:MULTISPECIES: glycerophosphoryl diester phosphodiesterase membrane domain-containing protein [unclassified Streptomyces]|uniref:glycerophosphoryl diester phosphodiesterase membrane domain-containing protein n=1 Tax=unclassified Streptomyces TaxID=2593676 RepID=UPI00336A3FA3